MAESEYYDINIPPQLKKLRNYLSTIVLVVLALVVVYLSVFQVNPEEVGVITRFGAFEREVQPGLQFKIPFAEEVEIVPVQRQLKDEFGFRTADAGVQTRYQQGDYSDESLMLTGDLNLANVEWVVQYRIMEPYKYLFEVRNPRNTLRDISESAMREVAGDHTVNEVLTVGRTQVASEAQQMIQKLANEYNTGINIEQIVLQDVNPPDPVKDAFNKVNEAQQQKETLINEAKSDYNRVIPKAKGQAEETIQQAEGYAIERVNNAEGEVVRFNELYNEYIKAPEVTKRRIYLETMQNFIPKLGNKIITDKEGNSVLPLLQMNNQNISMPGNSQSSSSN